MIKKHTFWFNLILFWNVVTLSIAMSSNGTNNTGPFPYPYVKPDPYPVLVQGPAGELFNFTKIGYSTGGSFTTAYTTIPPGAGPPAHIHRWTNEWFYFPEGGIVVFSSLETYPDPNRIPNGIQAPKTTLHRYYTKPGDLIYAPPFYVHGFRNEDNVTHSMVFVWSPDKISQFFMQVGQILTDPNKKPPVSEVNKRRFVSEAPNYGINQSSSWDEYVDRWVDDWQPLIGMNANVEALLSLIGNATGENTTIPVLPSRAAFLHSSFECINLIGFTLIYLLSFLHFIY